MSSGYDAATWTSKYSIFDFKEEGETVHINSINKTYTAPAMVNVVTDGMNSKRVEDSCIDVATHFEGDSNFFGVKYKQDFLDNTDSGESKISTLLSETF